MSTRIIARGDEAAINALRLNAVLLDRAGGAWQVALLRYAEHPTRGWFRTGDATGNIYGAAVVADQGPLRILYDRALDVPTNVVPCPVCAGLTQHPESTDPCDYCAGEGWFIPGVNEPETEYTQPIALAEAIDRAAVLRPDGPVQGMLPPESLEAGMSVVAEPKPAYGSLPRVRGRVLEVTWPDAGLATLAVVDLMVLDDDGHLRPFSAHALKYSFRPLED